MSINPEVVALSRRPRDSKLETRQARRRLKARAAPFWRQIHSGLAVGYYKGQTTGSWYLRRLRTPADAGRGRFKTIKLGTADDHADADGQAVLDYGQAVKAAMREAESTPAQREQVVQAASQARYAVSACIEDYLGDLAVRSRHGRDAAYKLNHHVMPCFGDRAADSLTTDELRHWRNALAKGRSKATANRILTAFKAALNFAYHHDKVPDDRAWRRLKRFERADSPRTRYLTRAEAKRLINACEPDFRRLVHAALLTGGRYGELTAAEARDFDPEAGTLHFVTTKSGKDRYVPLTDEAVQHFALWCAGRAGSQRIFLRADDEPWSTAQQARRMKAACLSIKIDPPVSFHILRHTYGSLLALQGVPLKFIAEAMGHTDTRMTERHYAHLQRDDVVAQAIRAKLPSFGRPDAKVKAL
jgi:integrase